MKLDCDRFDRLNRMAIETNDATSLRNQDRRPEWQKPAVPNVAFDGFGSQFCDSNVMILFALARVEIALRGQLAD